MDGSDGCWTRSNAELLPAQLTMRDIGHDLAHAITHAITAYSP
jgi:hypothetical protein